MTAARFDGFDETQPGVTYQDLADVMARVREGELDGVAARLAPEPVAYRSAFEEFEATGRYPLRPGLEDRSAAAALSATTAGALVRISARGQVAWKAWRKAAAEARKAGRS